MKILLLPSLLAAFAFAPPSTGTTTAPHAPKGDNNWTIDPVHSSVMFRVKHAGISWFQGAFDVVEGTVHYDPADPTKDTVKLSIPLDKLDTRDAKRDAHLKSPDFFNSKENPDITFTSTKIEKAGASKLKVTGDLAMAGKSKSITIEVEKTGEGDMMGPRIGWWTTFTIKRSDFSLGAKFAEGQLGDDVTLAIGLETTQAK